MKPYSILHISDIHRGPNTDLDNLYESLVSDAERYTADGVQKPSLIVVSGDIAEGASGKDAEVEVRKQYAEASVFLHKLTDYFLDGDKNRLIMVPGNHDMFRGTSASSMTKYEIGDDETVKYLLKNPEMRWSWKDLSFYQITDPELYKKRFDLFVEFYNNFYEGLRTIEGDAEEFSDVVDLPDYGISFVLFNSCYHLDHLRYTGTIYASAVSRKSSTLRKLSKAGRLIVGVWHHHTHGLPEESNYMDYRILQSMVAAKIHVGLYGHQHISQIINHYSDVEEEREMLLISSGSLYGGKNQLITGCPRQYNVVEIAIADNKAHITVNVREDKQSTFEIPDWGLCTLGKQRMRANYQIDIPLEVPATQDEQLLALDEEAKRTNDYDTAVRYLYSNYRTNPRYDALLDGYLPKIHITGVELYNLLKHPKTEAQAIVLLSIVDDIGNKRDIRKAVEDPYVASSTSSVVKELRLKLINKYLR